MKLTLQGHDDLYCVEQLQLALFAGQEAGEAVSSLHRGKTWLTAVTKITLGDATHTAKRRLKAEKETVRSRRQLLQQCYYLAALPFLSEVPAWGALSGVRPTKLTTKCLLEGGSEHDADKLLQNTYFVTKPRRTLALDCSKSTVAAARLLEPTDISLYIGIPFCPTRCAYCSFVSRGIGKRTGHMEPWLAALEKEMEVTGRLLRQSGRRVRTVYIGGGTPTTLTAAQLKKLMENIHQHFDLRNCLEFTVEGGRPDTLDLEKLTVLRTMGADRMSINPQSMVDSVLKASGRPHTGEDILRAYRQAKDAGFEDINMDLIAGLPGDTLEGFRYSLDAVAALAPSNITVHTLALKKGADLFESKVSLPDYETVSQMVAYAGERLRALGYKPYYLYRQKYMSGSFENVGWSRGGKDCLYNIYMMEEVHSILSLGAGVTKVNLPGGKLERFTGSKYPEQYISSLDSILAQKETIFELLKGSV